MKLLLIISIIGVALGEVIVEDATVVRPIIPVNPGGETILVEPRDDDSHPILVEPRLDGSAVNRVEPRAFFVPHVEDKPPMQDYVKPAVTRQFYSSENVSLPSLYSSYEINESKKLNGEFRYIFDSPEGSKITLNCTVLNVIDTKNVFSDGLSVSQSGGNDTGSFRTSYGNGHLVMSSISNSLAIKFFSGSQRRSGDLGHSCKVIAEPQTPPATLTPATTTMPTDSPAPSTTMAPPTTTEPASRNCTCGKRSLVPSINLIPYNVDVNEFPWRCTLQDGDSTICGATLISPNYVLTAASCLHSWRFRANFYTVKCGHDYDTRWVHNEALTVTISVDNYIPHPQYGSSNHREHDISLLHLSSPMKYSSEISPACLPFNNCGDQCKGDKNEVFALGTRFGNRWGRLQKLDLRCTSSETCQKSYSDTYDNTSVTNNMICTATEIDSRRATPGGSIDFAGPSGYCAIGVSSYFMYGTSVHANVANYLPWIQDTTGERFCGDGK